MEPIVIRCPKTGAEVEVGIETDRDTFSTLPDISLVAVCPRCGQQHEWSPARAKLRSFGRARAERPFELITIPRRPMRVPETV